MENHKALKIIIAFGIFGILAWLVYYLISSKD